MKRFTENEMLEHAARAVGKIDNHGRRGLDQVTHDEMVAMATTLVCLGLKPIPPGMPAPETLLPNLKTGEET